MSCQPQTPPGSYKATDPASPNSGPGWRVWGICAAILVLVCAVFGRTVYHDFVNYDDTAYVYENPVVAKGLTLEGVGWAFTHVHADNWHPLTTLSHMLDCQLFGLNPAGHHLHNVLLHALASVLLFLMLRELTGATWRSAFVAALFAIHPLRVESVAWVAERKDVLSGVFFMLTLRAYVRFVRHPASRKSYALVLLWFALGLMSKPMLVTVPFVLLLLDYWPLKRLRQLSHLPGLLLEKLPLFLLTLVSCAATIIAQRGVMQPLEQLDLLQQSANALVAYVAYLGMWVRPVDLAVLYPILNVGWVSWPLILSILLVSGFSAAAWILRWRQPFLLVGWLWYLGMLVPVIGMVQVGFQAYADRYTYLPQIGLGLAVTWLVAEVAPQWRHRTAALSGLAAVVLGILSVAAAQQLSHWKNSHTLWTHALECTRDNAIAHNNLGNALIHEGRVGEALQHFLEAIRIFPRYAEAHNNLGNTLLLQKRAPEAMEQFSEAIQINPRYAEAHYNAAVLLFKMGQADEALAHYQEALRINPGYVEARYNLGTALLQLGHPDEAALHFRAVLHIDPNHSKAHNNLGNALFQLGQLTEAITHFREALRIDPANVEAHNNLGTALLQQGQDGEAIEHFRKALVINPDYAKAHGNLGSLLLQQGMADEALAHTEKAHKLQPDSVEGQCDLAWMLATTPKLSLRNGTRALQLARLANQATGGENPLILRILAAAQAQTGDFKQAVNTANKALSLSGADTGLASSLQEEIKIYQSGKRHY